MMLDWNILWQYWRINNSMWMGITCAYFVLHFDELRSGSATMSGCVLCVCKSISQHPSNLCPRLFSSDYFPHATCRIPFTACPWVCHVSVCRLIFHEIDFTPCRILLATLSTGHHSTPGTDRPWMAHAIQQVNISLMRRQGQMIVTPWSVSMTIQIRSGSRGHRHKFQMICADCAES